MIAAIVVLAACSRDDETLTVVEFQRQANAICAPATAEIDDLVVTVLERSLSALGEEPFEPVELQQELYANLVSPTERAAVVTTDMLDALRDLHPPADVADDYAMLWDGIQSTVARSGADIAEAARDPAAAAELWDLEASPLESLDARARELGVSDCTLDT